MRGFFDVKGLKAAGLEVKRIWERNCNGVDRECDWDRGRKDLNGAETLDGASVAEMPTVWIWSMLRPRTHRRFSSEILPEAQPYRCGWNLR
jgi:hypothetical protein